MTITTPASIQPLLNDAEIYKIWSDSNAAWHQLIGSKPDRNNHFARAVEAEVIRRTAQAPQPVANNWTQMLGRMSWCYESNCMRADEDGPFVAYSDVVAVAPKAAPTLAKELLDVLGLPGTAGIRDVVVYIEDLKAAVHDAEEGHNQPAAPLQQGEYPPLPEPVEIHWPDLNAHALGCGVEDRGMHDRYRCAEYGWQDGVDRAVECVPEEIYDAEQMRAYVDADRAARGAAQATQAAQAAPAEPDHRAVFEAASAYITAYGVMDSAMAHGHNVHGALSGLIGATDNLREAIGSPMARAAPVAEDAEDAARYRWLKLQARPNEPFELFDKLREAHALVKAFDVFCTRWGGWDASIDAARAQAAQPEGGAKS